MGHLTDQMTVVTGGSRGIGAAIVRRLVAAGARTVIAGGSAEAAHALVAELGDEKTCRYVAHDVASEESWNALVAQVLADYGRIDGLVNNAGIYRPGDDLLSTATSNFDDHYRVNQLGVFLGMRAVAAPMVEAGRGSIVNVASIASHRAYPNQIGYSTSKWAVRGMTKCAAVELGRHGVRVNSVHPGFIDTSMLDVISDEFNDAAIAATPFGRRGEPAEIADAVCFLISPESRFVTGAELVVDGGLAA